MKVAGLGGVGLAPTLGSGLKLFEAGWRELLELKTVLRADPAGLSAGLWLGNGAGQNGLAAVSAWGGHRRAEAAGDFLLLMWTGKGLVGCCGRRNTTEDVKESHEMEEELTDSTLSKDESQENQRRLDKSKG